jgi:four helix bundle protein
LNIAEGSNSQTDAEQARFLGLAIRSLVETVACQHLIRRRGFMVEASQLDQVYRKAEVLAAKMHALRKAIAPSQAWLREEKEVYQTDET